jgi:hypothetical protein
MIFWNGAFVVPPKRFRRKPVGDLKWVSRQRFETLPGLGLGRGLVVVRCNVSLGLAFHPHQFFQHLVGRTDDLRGSRIGSLHHDHVGEFLTDIDC